MNTLLLLAALGMANAKKAKEGEGVLIEITVMNQEDLKPIPTAMIRHPDDVEASRVNELNGTWQASEIYLPDGGTLLFSPGSSLQLEISAPGFMTQIVQYDIRKRRNKIEIFLEKMEIDDSDIEMPTIPFGRDQEREPTMGGAAN
jgi:hypothetical protein